MKKMGSSASSTRFVKCICKNQKCRTKFLNNRFVSGFLKCKKVLFNLVSNANYVVTKQLFRAHISGRQTPGSPPHLLFKRGLNPGLNLGFGVLRCGIRALARQHPSLQKIQNLNMGLKQ
jgi:hypothetical protein